VTWTSSRWNETGSSCLLSRCPQSSVKQPATVARDLGLETNWLNAGPTGLLLHGLPEGFVERLVNRVYGAALRVSFAARVDQIFFKLYAAADRKEARDFSDLERLAPNG